MYKLILAVFAGLVVTLISLALILYILVQLLSASDEMDDLTWAEESSSEESWVETVWVEAAFDGRPEDYRGFPKIAFYYPDGMNFTCCHDFGGGTSHLFQYPSTNKSLESIKITKHELYGCPVRGAPCDMRQVIAMTPEEKREDLIYFEADIAALEKVYIKNLDTWAYKLNYMDRYGTTTQHYYNYDGEVFTIAYTNIPDGTIKEFTKKIAPQ